MGDTKVFEDGIIVPEIAVLEFLQVSCDASSHACKQAS